MSNYKYKFKVIRYYFNDNIPSLLIATGLTFEQAQEHCKNPETSSTTCKLPENIKHTQKFGPWFDGYSEK